ncbi:hypothetical protein TTHERM_01020850 (macronuclear) [Tetrahymena thermophila SB210]|uniref:Uncharacterized protein n=1 Tax=Tetrahymena thermophila (strain SB210) TaxID=312017 RepID=Q24BY5_TETTS|nr:hypothetical protein TTHERM_01020850 [Tetrahymena thermophila SB210]EAS05317.2 hypothetical protein TTHERM_01020850 [Tetrahymena thermophila SB210]|eukprot:XP_001025562.2 hypothetical protein TTHERM_01020850 [Tetrahymena thermophila SB210]
MMSLQIIKNTCNISSQQTTCNSRQDDNMNSSADSPSSSRIGNDYQQSTGAIRGHRSSLHFEQSTYSTIPTQSSSLKFQLDSDFIFDNFSQLFEVKFDKQIPKPKEVQAQKSLIFMFEAIALQEKQRQQQQQKLKTQEQCKQTENQTYHNQIEKESHQEQIKCSVNKPVNNLTNKPIFNTRAERDAYFAEQVNTVNQVGQQQNIECLKPQKITQNIPNQTEKIDQIKKVEQPKQQQQSVNSPTQMSKVSQNVSTLPSVGQKIAKKRNLSIFVSSPNSKNIQTQQETNSKMGDEEKSKKENSVNIKYIETHQTITINQDKDNYYNTDIYGQQGNASKMGNNNSSSNFVNENYNLHHHQRSKSNISYINLQTNTSSMTNHSGSNNHLSSTQTSFFQNALNQIGQNSTKNNNQALQNKAFQQSYTSYNNNSSLNQKKQIQKGNSKRKIVKISSKSQQSQHQNNYLIEQAEEINQNNASSNNQQLFQLCNNTNLSINTLGEGSKSLQNTQPLSKKSFNQGILNEDMFKLNYKGSNAINKENCIMNRKISLQEAASSSLSSHNNLNLKTTKYIFNMTNKSQNTQKNSFLSSLAQNSQNDTNNNNSIINQFTQKFQHKKNLSQDLSSIKNQLSLKQQVCNNLIGLNSLNNPEQMTQNVEAQFASTRYSNKNNKPRNSSRERSKNNNLKNSINLKCLQKNGKFNIRTINQNSNNPSSSSMNSNNLYNASAQIQIEKAFKSCTNSNIQSYQNIPDTIFSQNE